MEDEDIVGFVLMEPSQENTLICALYQNGKRRACLELRHPDSLELSVRPEASGDWVIEQHSSTKTIAASDGSQFGRLDFPGLQGRQTVSAANATTPLEAAREFFSRFGVAPADVFTRAETNFSSESNTGA